MARKPAPVVGVYERVAGSGVWHARYRQKGKLVRKSFGRDRAAAVAYVEKARTLKRSGEGIVPSTAKLPVRTLAETVVAGNEVLLSELCDGLLKHIKAKPKKYKDQRNPPQRVARICEKFGHRPAASIKPYEISEWLSGLGLAPATMNRYKAVFSAIYRWGKEQDEVQVNPVRDFAQERLDNGVIRFLTPAEETRLRKVLQKDVDACGPQNERLKKHLLHRIYELDVALGTGMRKGEQYGLTWKDIDFDRRVIIVRDTKNGTNRTIPMIDDVVAAMKALKAMPLVRKQRDADTPNESPVDSVFSIGDNKKWWATALRRAKIKNLRWHDLRHTFCSRLAQSGANLKVIQEAAGHRTIQMSARYSHMDQTTMRNALAVLNREKQ
jgi:integrase